MHKKAQNEYNMQKYIKTNFCLVATLFMYHYKKQIPVYFCIDTRSLFITVLLRFQNISYNLQHMFMKTFHYKCSNTFARHCIFKQLLHVLS